MTQQQDVVQAKSRIEDLKQEYMQALHRYLPVQPKSSPEARDAALEVQARGAAYFNCAEEFVGNSDLLGAHRSDLWAQGFAEDCAEHLRSMPQHFGFLSQVFENVPDLRNLSTKPGATAYANMQRMVVEYLTPEIAKELRKVFVEAELPVYGFDNKVTVKSSSTMKTLSAYAFGLVFVAVVLAIAYNTPEPTRFQAAVFWAVLALALAGVASVIPGFVQVTIPKWVVAGGPLAVFVIVYFSTPADVSRGKPPETAASPRVPQEAASAPP